MQLRHNFLWDTIGYLDEEENTRLNIIWLICASFVAISIGGIIQWFFFTLYNKKYHPFRDIFEYTSCEI